MRKRRLRKNRRAAIPLDTLQDALNIGKSLIYAGFSPADTNTICHSILEENTGGSDQQLHLAYQATIEAANLLSMTTQ